MIAFIIVLVLECVLALIIGASINRRRRRIAHESELLKPPPVPAPELGEKWRPRAERISLVVPFRPDVQWRADVWNWLHEYWRHELPEAEIIVSGDDNVPFCKTAAVNRGVARATGDVIVILDADCLTTAGVIRHCAKQIRTARARGERLWFMPYRRFFRLNQETSEKLLTMDPALPIVLKDPLPVDCIDAGTESGVPYGHWYGALIQIHPRESFEVTWGMDERFRGWGGEDVAFMLAVDTLYARHKTVDAPVYHVWHPSIKGTWAKTRQWEGQPKPEMNDKLTTQYEAAFNDPKLMRRLVDGDPVRAECMRNLSPERMHAGALMGDPPRSAPYTPPDPPDPPISG